MNPIFSRSLVLASAALLGSIPLLAGLAPAARGDSPAATTRATSDIIVSTSSPDLRALYAGPPEGWPAANWMEGAERQELGLLPKVEHPASNPYSREKFLLGRELFFDPRLSSSNGVACVSCHHPDLAWADGKVASQGHHLQASSRNAPSLLNVAFRKHLMWDGRAATLEDQALLPLANTKEMHADFGDVVKNLNAIEEYRGKFKAVFGDEGSITMDRVTQAIACFERTLVGGRSRFDQFLAGKTQALTDQEIRGLHLFRTSANCINCHSGPTLSDGKFHNIGLTYYGRKFEDMGLYDITRKPEDVGKFLTPPLRNVTRTAPYMHNGFFELDGVINLYNAGGPKVVADTEAELSDPLFPKKDPLLKPLKLTREDREALLAFLQTLEEPKTRLRVDLPGEP